MSDQSRLKLLCVTAHPDDECFGFGGALMLAHEAGIETSVLCFTDGIPGRYEASGFGPIPNRASRRTPAAFARNSPPRCKILDVDPHYEVFGDYQDKHNSSSPTSPRPPQGWSSTSREYKPDVVLTFGQDGAVTYARRSHHGVGLPPPQRSTAAAFAQTLSPTSVPSAHRSTTELPTPPTSSSPAAPTTARTLDRHARRH